MEIIEEENGQDENLSQPKKSKNPFKKTYDEKYAESTKLSDTQRSRRFEDFFSLVKGLLRYLRFEIFHFLLYDFKL